MTTVDVHDDLLPYLAYRPTDVDQLDKERDDLSPAFKRGFRRFH